MCVCYNLHSSPSKSTVCCTKSGIKIIIKIKTNNYNRNPKSSNLN